MFVDRIKVHAKAGDGGDGCVSFRREKFVPKGGPDGGDGGRGGDIVLRADPQVDNLATFFYEPIIKAKDGANGGGKNCYGRAAKNKIVPVPVGTIVYRPAQDESEVREIVVDLAEPEQQFVLCKGGGGGKGNVHFKSSRNRVPRQFTPGGEGEEADYLFELRTIADAGLVGYPNAGKSTLLGAVSAAHPKVAPYPFTTLHPIVGVVDFPGYQRATIADIPGLIEGAHRNVGLGHDFLRHITRCKLLLFVIDMAGSEGRNPLEDLAQLRQELKLYDETLAGKPWLVVANKMDLPGAEENLAQFKQRYRNPEVIAISAEQKTGLEKLVERIGALTR
ncbi:MAG: GTPase ObgE [Verrucomicrobiota bacterium]|nr:GTPase ObgE [Verrucomicrobiota bacterium]